MLGGELPSADEGTLSLLTNPEVLAVNQHSTGNHPLESSQQKAVWVAQSTAGQGIHLAIFNLQTSPQSFRYSWNDLGLPASKYKVRDLWERKDLGAAESLTVTLPPHGSVLYTVSPAEKH